MSESDRNLHIPGMGQKEWTRHIKTISEMWRNIRGDYTRVRLCQDGAPNCDDEIEIVRDPAEAGSQNHRLVLELVEKGAEITGTESPELLPEEYELPRQLLTAMDSG